MPIDDLVLPQFRSSRSQSLVGSNPRFPFSYFNYTAALCRLRPGASVSQDIRLAIIFEFRKGFQSVFRTTGKNHFFIHDLQGREGHHHIFRA